LLLYPILTIAVASLSESKQNEMAKRTAMVAVVDGQGAPKLLGMLNDPDGLVRTIQVQPAEDTKAELDSGEVDAVLTVPANYESDAIADRDMTHNILNVAIDRSRLSTPSVEAKINKVLNSYQEWIIQQRLAAHGLPTDLATVPRRVTTDMATSEQTFGALMAQILPLLLLLTGMLGSLYPALSATTNERELGTLETLLVTPATREELLTAKAGIVLISGLLTALLNMVSMSLVFWRVMSQMGRSQTGFSIDPTALALSYLAAVPTIIFFTSLVLMVGLLARNLREANAYATPLMMVPIISMLVGVADPATTPGLLVTPVVNTTLIIRAVLVGKAHFGSFALAFMSAGLYAGLMLSLAARLFTNEQLVNPAWEPLSLRGLGRRSKRPRWPAVDEALCLFAVSLLLNFYLSPSWVKYGLLPLLIGVEVLLIAGPAVLFGYLGHYPWKEVFSLRRPRMSYVTGSILLGVGMIPLMNGLSDLQQHWHILPPNQADMEGMSQLFEPTLRAHPIFAPLLIGLLAGVCEELLFRGPIQAALVRRFSIWPALIVGGLLFAAAHVDLPGLPARMILGIVLGWIVWRGGSIFPAMIMHGVYDAVSVGWSAHLLKLGLAESSFSTRTVIVGAVASVVGWMLIRRQSLRRDQFKSREDREVTNI
jgi:ABC-type Na+ efflux pump permease subunit/membrane protease YdiL (CAAX protease family)